MPRLSLLAAVFVFSVSGAGLWAEESPEAAKQHADLAFKENMGAVPAAESQEAGSTAPRDKTGVLETIFSKQTSKRRSRIPSPENFGVDPNSKKGFWENALGDAAALLSVPAFGMAVLLIGPVGTLALAAGGAIAGSLAGGDPLVGVYSVLVWPLFTSLSAGAKLGAKIDGFFKSR